ncbi:DoxX family protein [Actinomyces radicidentis]|nr:DoxX family protein [Actinomyces radicidentis]
MASTDTMAKDVVRGEDRVTSAAGRKVLAVLRIIIGFYFLWAFIDKTFGFGFATAHEKAWIRGGTPAQGFIKFVAAKSPFSGFFNLFANSFGDILFMLGLLAIGTALILGIGLKVTSVAAPLLLLFMYLAEWPIATGGTEDAATNPIVDDHWVMAFAIIFFMLVRAGDTWGLGKWWRGLVDESWLR